jgi:hypothetical protein
MTERAIDQIGAGRGSRGKPGLEKGVNEMSKLNRNLYGMVLLTVGIVFAASLGLNGAKGFPAAFMEPGTLFSSEPGIAGVFAFPAYAVNDTRSCDAYYQWETTGGSFSGTFGQFTGKGGCGATVPNRCRERARDAAMNCMTTHRDIRWERRTPEACLNAAGVYGYDVGIRPCTSTSNNQCMSPKKGVPSGDLKTRLEVEVCCAFGRASQYRLRCEKNVHVRVKAVVTGGEASCGKTRELFDDYVIEDCSAIWKNICAQSPQQPTGC